MNTTSGNNPYQPPKADVTPPPQEYETGELVADGQTLAAGSGVSWIGEGFRLFGKSPGVWIVITLIMFLIAIVLAFIPFLGGIASNLLTPIFSAGIMLGCRSLDAGDSLRVEHLFAGFKEKAGQLVLVGLLLLVATVALIVGLIIVAVIVLGPTIFQMMGDQEALTTWFIERGLVTILLFVLIAMALSIPLAMAYWFAPALVVFHDLDAVSAMKKSFQGCLRNILPFLLYGLVLFILGIVAIIPIGLGLLVLFPVVYASMFASYKEIYLKV